MMTKNTKMAAFFLLGLSVGSAYAADYSGAYQDPSSPLSYILIIQKGNVVVLTSNSIIPDDASLATSSSVVGWGIGSVSGNQIDVPEFHDNFAYCVNHHVWTVAADGNTISRLITSSTPTARGNSAGFNCAQNVGQTGTRVKIW